MLESMDTFERRRTHSKIRKHILKQEKPPGICKGLRVRACVPHTSERKEKDAHVRG